MTQDIAIFKAMTAKMGYLDAQQRVIAQNVANADTPDYKARHLTELDFGDLLDRIAKPRRMSVSMEGTHPDHKPAPGEIPGGENKRQRVTYEVAPADNAVVLEEQLIAATQTIMDYNTMTNLYTKHIGMMNTALGRGGR